MIHFVGAGSGAPDLITVRGKKYLEEADVVIYAGSLVNPKLLEYTKDICTIYNSAKMTLEEVIHVIEKAEAAVDQEAAQEMSKKLKKMDFDFNDYLTSLEQMNKMGGISSILNMLPGVGSKMKDVESMIDEKAMDRTKSIILSMTPQERSNPGILNLSRKNRIARGAGVEVAEVNRLVKQFEQSKKMMKQMPGLMGGGKMGGKRGGFKLPF